MKKFKGLKSEADLKATFKKLRWRVKADLYEKGSSDYLTVYFNAGKRSGYFILNMFNGTFFGAVYATDT